MDYFETNNSYNVLKRALVEIDRAERNLSLSELSARLGISTARFQRLFSRWAAVSPIKYQRYLRLEYSKELLQNHVSSITTNREVKLSAAGQLHNPFLPCNAITSNELTKNGYKRKISFCWRNCPFGEVLIMATEIGICGIAFSSEKGRQNTLRDMTKLWPKAQFHDYSDKSNSWADSVFDSSVNTPLHVIGTRFQIKVWEALMQIPSGQVTTYSSIADVIGKPNAARAVGTAIGRNPISWIIPCHRVLRKSGALGGYHWGIPVKRAMLAFEAARRDAEQACGETSLC